MDLAGAQRLIEEFAGAVAPPDDPRERKRRRLLEAATELFTRHGYRRVSVDEIARAAHVAKGTVYLYFQNKADILFRCVNEEKRRYLARMAPVFSPELSARGRLEEFIRLALVMTDEMPLMSSLLGGEREILYALEELDPEVRQRLLGIQTDWVTQLVTDAAGPGTLGMAAARERADVVMSLLYSARLLTEERVRRGVPLERYASALAAMLAGGVGCAESEPAVTAPVASAAGGRSR